MANPVKASDLVQDDGAIKALTEQLKGLEAQIDAINRKSVSLEKETRKLSAGQSTQREEIKRTANEAAKLEREQEKLKESYSDTSKQLASLRQLKNEQNRLNKLEAKLAKATAGSYDALSAQYSINRLKINKLSKEYLENTKAGQNLVKETKELRDAMKDSQAATGNMSLNVGNYTESIEKSIPGVARFKGALQTLAKTPLLAVLTLVVGAVSALFQAFKKTERGAAFMAKASGFLQGIMSALVGIVDRLAGNIIKAFQDPQAALKSFANALKESIINRFEALVKLIPAVGKALFRLLKRDLSGAKDAFKEAGQAAVQLYTGLDAEQQKEFADAIRETTQAAIDQANAFANLAAAQRSVRKQNRALSKELEEATTNAELLSAAAGDGTLSFREQQEAAEKARAAIEEKARIELSIAKNSLGILNQEIKLRRQNGEEVEDLADRQLGAYQEVKAAERDLTLAIRDNSQQRREIQRDIFERELDFAIDAFDTIKTVNERRIADDERSLDERRLILEETRRLTDEAFQDQIKLTEDYLGQKLDLDQLALESDQRIIRERLRAADIDDVTFGRVLEIIRERKLAVEDLADAEKGLNDQRVKNARAAADAIDEEIDRIVEAELEGIEKTIQAAEAIKPGGIKNIYDLLGFSPTEQQKQGIQSTFDAAKDALNDYLSARTQFADRLVQQADRAVQASQDQLNAEIEAQKAGLANRAETAREELAQARATQAEALREQEKAQRNQRRLQSIQQASNLITATSKIWAQLGFPLAIPAIGVLWGSFIASKVRAGRLARDEFAEGGFEMLAGGSHQSGNDISLGVGANGRERRAEGGEGLAIFAKKRVRQYGAILPEVVDAINRGVFQSKYSRVNETGAFPVMVSGGMTDTSRMESELTQIRRQGEREISYDGRGRKIVKYKNLTQTYV